MDADTICVVCVYLATKISENKRVVTKIGCHSFCIHKISISDKARLISI